MRLVLTTALLLPGSVSAFVSRLVHPVARWHRRSVACAAILLVTTAAQAQPDRTAYAEGMRALRANDAPTAVSRFERAIALNDRVGEYHLRLGLALGQEAFSANPVRQALIARRVKQSFERAVELDPSLVEAREGLLFFYAFAPSVMGGNPEKAREQQRELLRRDPMRGHMATATLALRDKDTVTTERALRQAMVAAPDSAAPVITLAQRQQAWGRTPAAFQTLDAFLTRHPNDVAARIQFGRLAGATGQQLARGERLLREVLAVPSWEVNQFRPSKASVHYRLGVVLAKAGKTADARAAYEAALRLDPKLKPAREALAELRG